MGRHVDGLGEATRLIEADEFHVRTDVRCAGGAVVAVQTGVQWLDGVEGVGEAGASVDNSPNDLVAHDDVVIPRAAASVDVEIRAADAAGAHVDSDSARGKGAGIDVFHDHALRSPF